ncbi:MAG: ABC transporter substrate-binding protein, partial [Actinobacteria bacterium]|nr:ABC transporter substrate-binding protein [Actinomycetota bacterium]
MLAVAVLGAACAGEQPKHLGLAGQAAALGPAATTTTTGAAGAEGAAAPAAVSGSASTAGAGTAAAAGNATAPGGSGAAVTVTSGPRAAAGAFGPGNAANPRAAAAAGPSPAGAAPATGAGGTAAVPAQGNGGATDVGVTADSIKLGGFFIESGPVGELGITLLKSVKAVFNEVNSQGGIYGRKLQMVDCDTSFTSGDKPRACYTKLTQQDKIFAFSATGDGPAWVTAAPLACKDKIPALWTDGLSQNEFECPTIFPTGPAGRSQARVVLDYYIKAKKPKTVGILLQNDDIGREWLVGAKE